MYLIFACLFLGVAWYFRKWFLPEKHIPAFISPVVGATTPFQSVVPLAETEELTIELDNDFDRHWEMYKPVLIEEADTVLLLEAEKLITEVETIAAAKEDVYGKLKDLIPGFLMLHKTDYYEAINTFIFQTLQSQCGIELSEAQLAALWK